MRLYLPGTTVTGNIYLFLIILSHWITLFLSPLPSLQLHTLLYLMFIKLYARRNSFQPPISLPPPPDRVPKTTTHRS